jgi:hypothetical protein
MIKQTFDVEYEATDKEVTIVVVNDTASYAVIWKCKIHVQLWKGIRVELELHEPIRPHRCSHRFCRDAGFDEVGGGVYA